jgi:CubicO group peptidase (beta-lactamase class C family)
MEFGKLQMERQAMTTRRSVLATLAVLPLAAVFPRRAQASFSSAAAYSRSFTSDHAVLIWRDGTTVFEDGEVTKNYGVASISKSLTGLVLARLMDEGRFGPDSFLSQYLPSDWVGSDSRKRSIRLWHAMTMCTGLQPHDNPGQPGYDPLALQTVANPAVEWAYASAPVDLLGIAAQRRTGSSVASLFNSRICNRLGIPSVSWRQFDGYTRASSGAIMSARNLVKIGQLMLADGRWRGVQIISASRSRWLRSHPAELNELTFKSTPGSPFPMSSSAPRFYGRLWWTNVTGAGLGTSVPRGAYYAHGLREQLLVVVPDRRLVVVRLGMQPVALAAFRNNFMSRVMEGLAPAA